MNPISSYSEFGVKNDDHFTEACLGYHNGWQSIWPPNVFGDLAKWSPNYFKSHKNCQKWQFEGSIWRTAEWWIWPLDHQFCCWDTLKFHFKLLDDNFTFSRRIITYYPKYTFLNPNCHIFNPIPISNTLKFLTNISRFHPQYSSKFLGFPRPLHQRPRFQSDSFKSPPISFK